METTSAYGTGTVMTVTGPVTPSELGVTDAHSHLWISPARGVIIDAPHVTDTAAVTRQLVAFRHGGGHTIIDCQPVFCGRNAVRLLEFSTTCDVAVVASTGFHLRRYYTGEESVPWKCSPEQASELFIGELTTGMVETASMGHPVRAGLIKVACEDTVAESPMALLEAAAEAALRTGAAIEVHTQRGADALRIFALFEQRRVGSRVILCHMDKRPDAGLHRELIQAGALLEYDTFLRPQYAPEDGAWPLIEFMANHGLVDSLCIGTDMVSDMWDKGTSLADCFASVPERLVHMGCTEQQVAGMTGRNVADRLALV
ncbi:MAG: phosphotriesterase family protein [Candidatus Cryosericum sp.]